VVTVKVAALDPLPAFKLSHQRRRPFGDPHDPHEPLVLSQRQQRQAQDQSSFSTSSRTSTSPDSTNPRPRRDLRRANDPNDSPPRVRRRRSPSFGSANANSHEPRIAQRHPTATDPQDLEPHPAVRISRRQHFAILYAIEEAIRTPYPFTPVLEEERESITDLMGDNTQGSGRSVPSIRTPRDIMADRLAREARREAEASRQREGEQRSSDSERRRAAAAAMERMAGPVPTSSSARISEDSPGDFPSRQRSHSQSAQQAKSHPMSGHRRSQTGARVSSAPDPPLSTQVNDFGYEDGVPESGTRSSFPHAFERWENLSSHWEGLTSYWLRKIEGNTEEIRGIIPSASAMQRQIQDLSAAGANLFHALVELQRLRASSERKFKRWFNDTKGEQEKSQETRADLQGQINTERRLKEEYERKVEKIHKAYLAEKNRANEDRRELNIAKAEARRAWESLGEMEAKNTEIMNNLRQGIPTNIGGIQVVPMHAASTQDSERRPTTGASIGNSPQYQQARSQQSPQTHHAQQQYQPIVPDIQYQEDEPSPTNTDPFTESARAGQQLHHEPDMQQLESDARQPYAPGSASASSSTARTAISPRQQRRDISPQEISPLSPNVTTTRPIIQPSHAATVGAASDQPELFYQQPPGKVYLHTSPGGSAARSITPVAEAVHGTHDLGSRPSYESNTTEGTEYEIDEHGVVRRDTQGRPVVYRNPGRGANQNVSHVSSEEYDTAADVARERELAARYGVGMPPPPVPRAPTSSAEAMASFATSTADDIEPAGYRDAEPADYEGAGYGSDWEALQSRHHHPTRLSDVLEEDERSRTTAE
jgi:hypothetical protein